MDAPGLVVLGPGDEVELITPPARELLASIRADGPAYDDDGANVTPVLALAGFVRAAAETGQRGSNVVTVPGDDGWITLHASLPGSPGDGRVAIVLERASAAHSATVRLEAFGATAREREVATLLARGLSRADIAEELVLSAHTVEDHPKSLYEKVGVASRQELVARVFLDEYLPEVGGGGDGRRGPSARASRPLISRVVGSSPGYAPNRRPAGSGLIVVSAIPERQRVDDARVAPTSRPRCP